MQLNLLQRSLTDLFGAGSETSSSMLLFAFMYMIKYPEIQKNVHEEIDKVIGKDQNGKMNNVNQNHRTDMPYTDAVLHEIMRHACLVYAGW